SRSASTTVHPAAANASAQARPIPAAAPVTSATLPCLNMFVSLIDLRKSQLATATAKNLDLAQQSPPLFPRRNKNAARRRHPFITVGTVYLSLRGLYGSAVFSILLFTAMRWLAPPMTRRCQRRSADRASASLPCQPSCNRYFAAATESGERTAISLASAVARATGSAST